MDPKRPVDLDPDCVYSGEEKDTGSVQSGSELAFWNRDPSASRLPTVCTVVRFCHLAPTTDPTLTCNGVRALGPQTMSLCALLRRGKVTSSCAASSNFFLGL